MITRDEKILLGKLADAYHMANMADAESDGKDFCNDLNPNLACTVCMPLGNAMLAIFKGDYDVYHNFIATGLDLNCVEVFEKVED
jgi:hypothetical protein